MNLEHQENSKRFGTFGGVFVPNLLTILGVILFLRAGWVVGNAGLKEALIILCIANGITLLTSLSLSAVATNTKVQGGGAYFLISRSLGLEIGGSIGLPLFLAQAISVAFYIIGFVESLAFIFPDVPFRPVAFGVLIILFVIAWIGADLAIKTQYIVMAMLGLSLLSFFLGSTHESNLHSNWNSLYTENHSFWSVFAIFFPAVTGIMSGVSMSGDLKNPARSIPIGTIWAVCITFLIYALELIWLATNASRSELLNDTLVIKKIAWVPQLIYVGLWAATLSSALASLVAAPRTLQALGNDRVVPSIFAQGSGSQNEPRYALILSALISGSCLLIGTLNLIAPVISMFFLTTYGMINLAAGLEKLVSNPTYRPTFRVHWIFSAMGAIGCGCAMFLLSPGASIVSVGFIITVYLILKRRSYKTTWGDMRSGFWFALTRFGLLQMSISQQHVHNWRPVLLVLVGNPKNRLAMVQFANGLESNRGLLFMGQIITGEWRNLLTFQDKIQRSMDDFIQENRLSAVAQTVLAEDFEHGVTTLLQVAGLGRFQPNTVLIGWSDDVVKQAVFTRAVKRIFDLKINLLVFSEANTNPSMLKPCIDIWWRAKDNGSFMLTLAHLLKSSHPWHKHTIRVFRVITDLAGVGQTKSSLAKLVSDARIEAEVNVIVSTKPPMEVITETSEYSEICFAGIAVTSLKDKDNPLAEYSPLAANIRGHLFLSKNWHDFEL